MRSAAEHLTEIIKKWNGALAMPVPERQEVSFLPPVCSIGEFRSVSTASNGYRPRSDMTVIWYQGTFGLPDEKIAEQLREMPWETHAREFNY